MCRYADMADRRMSGWAEGRTGGFAKWRNDKMAKWKMGGCSGGVWRPNVGVERGFDKEAREERSRQAGWKAGRQAGRQVVININGANWKHIKG